MNKLIKLKLETLLEFQKSYPTSHVGGSIGLMLRGVDMKRSINMADLDITVDEFNKEDNKIDNLNERSDNNDFDFCVRKDHANDCYTKIDIRISPEPSFDIIEFEGENYNVSKLKDILHWKKKYAEKGVKKHEYDLIAIETGVRPVESIEFDELPF